MQAVRFETTVDENGEVRLTQLPFRAGERVEIIVLQQAPAAIVWRSYRCAGSR